MKKIQTILFGFMVIVSFIPYSNAAELRFFNPNILGKTTSESICPLEALKSQNDHLVEPNIIQLDTNDGVYIAGKKIPQYTPCKW